MCRTWERAVRVCALARVIMLDKALYSHSASLSPRRCIKKYQQTVRVTSQITNIVVFTYVMHGLGLASTEIYYLLTDLEGCTTIRFKHAEDSDLKLRKTCRPFQILPLCLGKIAKNLYHCRLCALSVAMIFPFTLLVTNVQFAILVSGNENS